MSMKVLANDLVVRSQNLSVFQIQLNNEQLLPPEQLELLGKLLLELNQSIQRLLNDDTSKEPNGSTNT